MNSLKRLTIFIVLCILIGTVVSLFLPSELELKKTVIIDADKAVVQRQLKTFKYQKINGYLLNQEDESWKYILSEQGLEVVSQLNFLFGFNPVTKFNAVFDREEIDKEFQLRFDSVIGVLEELPKIQGVQVENKMMENDIWYLSIRDTIDQMKMNNVHGKFYEEINQFLIGKELKLSDSPLVIYHFWSDTLVDIEVGANSSSAFRALRKLGIDYEIVE